MAQSPVPEVQMDPARRTALEMEKEALEHDRGMYSFWIIVCSLVAAGCLAGAYFLGARNGSNVLRWIFLAGANGAFCFVAAALALERGQHFAWGLLSVIGLAILALHPDRNLKRLDEIDEELTGQRFDRSADKASTTWAFIPFIGLLIAIYNRRIALSRGRSASSESIVYGIASTTFAVGLLIYCFMGSATDNVASGKLALVRLPPGWVDATTRAKSSSAGDPGFDVFVASRNVPAGLAVTYSPKKTSADFDAHVAVAANERSKVLGATFTRTGPRTRMTGSRRLVEYEFRGPPSRNEETVQLLTFWETPGYHWYTLAWTSESGFRSVSDDFRFIAENVYSRE